MAKQKLIKLKQILKEMGSVLIAYSGGVDSTFLLKVATDVLGDKAIGVTARSETYPDREYKASQELTEQLGFRQITIVSEELEIEHFVSNPTDRCYYCKRELFSKLKQVAEEHNISWVVDGSNRSDLSDYRPGYQGAKELGVRHPLQEADLNKDEIRQLSRDLGLPTWDKPAFACLASRFPYGEKITPEKLKMVVAAENFLLQQGLKQVRVRHHGDMARIEAEPKVIEHLATPNIRHTIVAKLKEIGYNYVSLDLQGYRTGSMNEGRNL